MVLSRHNIFSRVTGSDSYFLVNLLTGQADLLTAEEGAYFQDLQNGKEIPPAFRETLVTNGYLTDPDTESKLYRARYLDFLDRREEDEVQLFFVPNYTCNFACSYCYQDEYLHDPAELTPEITDAFFRYVQKEFAGQKKYITVFGGEPLLNSPRQRAMIRHFLERSNEAGLEVAIVSNGYFLEDYIDLLRIARIREVQVTLDGTGPWHDRRRFLKGGGATFDRIVRGIDACLANGLPINLRMVADKENIDGLPDLAEFAIHKGWTTHPLFKTQLGRNYELHHCQTGGERLFSRLSLYETIFSLTKKHPSILEFHKPAYSVLKFLSENGELPDPLFDACPACKTEWAFDYTGRIYSCTATVGKEGEVLGTYFPTVSRKDELVREWENRDVTTIPQCKDCTVQLACGGGCGSVAKNRNGTIGSPDCRPITDLMALGFGSYFGGEGNYTVNASNATNAVNAGNASNASN